MLAVPGIRADLVQALGDAGVKELTSIQSKCLPHCLAGSDVLGKAKTGTGKTYTLSGPPPTSADEKRATEGATARALAGDAGLMQRSVQHLFDGIAARRGP